MVGQNIGKYQVLDRIGRGGMGTVYRAMDETLRREVAIKVLNAELNDPAVAKRFHAEAITVARLSHPGIATVYELFQNEGQWLMVMEFVRGETLEALVTRKGPLPVEKASDIAMQALGALAHAHSLGVVHRDLKPANLMAAESGLVKIMDFGIARVTGTEHLTNAGFMMGTPAYMAPEQVLGEDIDARCDIYAMGAVLFYLLTGQLPFKGKSPFEMAQAHLRDEPTLLRTVRADLPEWAELIVNRALQRDPTARFQSAPLFHDALRRGLSGLPLVLSVAGPIPPELMVTGELPITAGTTGGTGGIFTGAKPETMETVLSPSRTGASAVPAPFPATGGPANTPSGPFPTSTTSSALPASGEGFASVALPAPIPVPVPVREPATSASSQKASKHGTGVIGAVAAGVVVLAIGGGWMWMRSRTPVPADMPAPTTATTPPAPSAATPLTSPPAATPPETSTGSAPRPTPPEPSSPSVKPPAPDSTTPPTAASASSTSPARASAAATRGDGRASATAAPVAGSAVPAPVVLAPVEFKDIRLLVIAGKKADERPVTLRFGDGAISALPDRGGAPIQTISSKDISYAAYARAKDPKWSVILASPPSDTDFPGGLFRSARHWLTLQSRSTFLILRLNDGDWRRVVDTVKLHTGVNVELSAPAGGR